jgi:hypothetical protein
VSVYARPLSVSAGIQVRRAGWRWAVTSCGDA